MERALRRKVADFKDQVPQMEAALGNIHSQAGELNAPAVHLASTHKRALEIVPLEILRQHAMDLN